VNIPEAVRKIWEFMSRESQGPIALSHQKEQSGRGPERKKNVCLQENRERNSFSRDCTEMKQTKEMGERGGSKEPLERTVLPVSNL